MTNARTATEQSWLFGSGLMGLAVSAAVLIGLIVRPRRPRTDTNPEAAHQAGWLPTVAAGLQLWAGVQGWAVVVRVGLGVFVFVIEVEVGGVLREVLVAAVPAVEPGTPAGPSGWTVRVGHGGGTESTVS